MMAAYSLPVQVPDHVVLLPCWQADGNRSGLPCIPAAAGLCHAVLKYKHVSWLVCTTVQPEVLHRHIHRSATDSRNMREACLSVGGQWQSG